MDQLTIDVTDIEGIDQGDIVTLIGQDNMEVIRVEDMAKNSGTISNEILSRLSSNRIMKVVME